MFLQIFTSNKICKNVFTQYKNVGYNSGKVLQHSHCKVMIHFQYGVSQYFLVQK